MRDRCHPGGWGEGLATWVTRPDGTREARWTGVLRTVDGMLEEPLRWKKPRRVFVNSMSDLFHEGVPDEFIDKVFAVMALASQHTFQILTKRPARMLAWATKHSGSACGVEPTSLFFEVAGEMRYGNVTYRPWPLPNVGLGVSVEDQPTFDERVTILGHVPAAVRFVSAEPLLGYVDARAALPNKLWNGIPGWNEQELNWVIIGGETGSNYRPMDMARTRSLIAQCKAAGLPTFVKQDSGQRPGMQGRFTDEEWALKQYPATAYAAKERP